MSVHRDRGRDCVLRRGDKGMPAECRRAGIDNLYGLVRAQGHVLPESASTPAGTIVETRL